MNTAERIKDLANKLNEEADYYGAYIDELLTLRGQTFGEFRKKSCGNRFALSEDKQRGNAYAFRIPYA